MMERLRFLTFIALTAALPCVLLGQPGSGTPLFRSDARLVILHATVTDQSGRLMSDLPQAAFTVFEDGVEQPLKVFRREDAPISLGLMVDTSASMLRNRSHVEAAAMKLVRASNPEDEVFVMKFNDEAFLTQPFTTDTREMERGLAKIGPSGGTAMRDALRTALEYLNRNATKEKKVLLVITDGADNSSVLPLEKLIRAAQEKDIVIHAIGLLSEEEKREAERAKLALTTITQATGGQAFYPAEIGDVNTVALQVAHDIRNQYVLGYSPANQELDGSFRQVRVRVNVPNQPMVRTRSGYYATSEPRSNVKPFPTPAPTSLDESTLAQGSRFGNPW